MWDQKIISFYKQLQPPENLPPDVLVLLPFADEQVMRGFQSFYHKFYNDNWARYAIIGINPGRFGGGVTGIPFTDPIRLEHDCGIPNAFPKKQELSSVFMYEMIRAFGGAKSFYKQFYVTAYSPLGFVKNGKNLNYYDDKMLAAAIEPFAAACLQQQLRWGLHRELAFCLGDGKNFQYLTKLNNKHGFFEKLVPLSHPRFIMQYRLKLKQENIQKYLEAFSAIHQ